MRQYDPTIGRFFSIDPLFEKYYGWSPHQYSANNPINMLDWNGKDVKYSVNGVLVANLRTSKIKDNYSMTLASVSIPKDFKPLEININDKLNDKNQIGYGVQIGGDIVAGGGGGYSIMLLDFTEGKDKNKGCFAYQSVSGKFGLDIGAEALFVQAFSDEPTSKVDHLTPIGEFVEKEVSLGLSAFSETYSFDARSHGFSNLFESIFGSYHKFYTKTFLGAGVSLGLIGLSGGIGQTFLLDNDNTKK